MPAKPLLVFDGNCQAQHLAAMIESTGAADTVYIGPDWGFLPAYRGRVCRVLGKEKESEFVSAAKGAGKRIVQISQMVAFGARSSMADRVEGTEERFFFPEVSVWAISPKRFMDRYKSNVPAERMLEVDLDRLRVAQGKSDFPIHIADFVRSKLPTVSLFHTVNHPSGMIFACLLQGLFPRLADLIGHAPLAQLIEDVETKEGLNYQTDHPVPADVRQRLGLEWGETYETYAKMLLATKQKQWEVLLDGRSQFESLFSTDTQYWRSYALLGSEKGIPKIALPAFEQLLRLCPGVRGPWVLYARFLRRQGNHKAALDLLDRAATLLGECAMWHGIAALVYMTAGQLAQAEAHAEAQWDKSPENIEAALQFLQVLVRRGKHRKIRSLISDLESRSSRDLEVIRTALSQNSKTADLVSLLPVT